MTEKFINLLTNVAGSHPVAANIYSRAWARLEAAGYGVETVIRTSSPLPRTYHNDPVQRLHIPEHVLQKLKQGGEPELIKILDTKMPVSRRARIGQKGVIYLTKALTRY